MHEYLHLTRKFSINLIVVLCMHVWLQEELGEVAAVKDITTLKDGDSIGPRTGPTSGTIG